MTKVIIKDVLVEGWNNFSKSSREARENDDVVLVVVVVVLVVVVLRGINWKGPNPATELCCAVTVEKDTVERYWTDA